MPDAYRPTSPVLVFILTATAAMSVITVVLLTAGTLSHHYGLLTWAMVTGMVALDLMVLLAVKRMMDDAVGRCVRAVKVDTAELVEQTAVRVGQAIAESLRDDEPVPPAPRVDAGAVRTLY